MAVDLHLHSSRSDGSDAPADIVRLAARAGLSGIALTDHDTLAGVGDARAAAQEVGLAFIPGVELSIEWPTGTMHLLVYGLEPVPGPLQDRLAELRSGRSTRNAEIARRLQALGIDVTLDDAVARAGGDVVGRPHFAAALVAKGHAESIADAFDRYLAVGRPAYVERPRLTPEEAIALARASGAVTSLAHPHTVGAGAADYEQAFGEMAAQGLDGIEAWYGEYEPALRRHLADLAASLGLIATGGSDYHGSFKPDLRVGVGRGDLAVPDEALHAVTELLRERETLDHAGLSADTGSDRSPQGGPL